MKELFKTTIVIIGLSTSAYAGGLSSPWDEPEVTVIKCPTYGILWGLIKWEWCGYGYSSGGSERSGGGLSVVSTVQDDVLDDRPDDDDVLDKPKKDKRPNSGRGNGDDGGDPGKSEGKNQGGDEL